MNRRPLSSSASQSVLVVGGLLLALGYLYWTCSVVIPQAVPGPSDTTVGNASLLVFGIAALLLAVGAFALIGRRQLRGTARFGGWLLVAGFLLWAFGAASGPMPYQLPWWWLHLSPLCVLFGSALFGAGTYRSGLVNRSGAVLIGVGGTIGMLLIDGPQLVWDLTAIDLAPGTIWRVLGYALLLLFGVGWSIVGWFRV